MRNTALFLLVVSLPVTAPAQSRTDSFGELNPPQLVQEANSISIEYAFEREAAFWERKINLVRLTDSAISTRFARAEVKILESRVSKATQQAFRGVDSIWNGVLIGAGVGGTAVALMAWYGPFCGSDWSCTGKAFAWGAAIGAGIGAAIDYKLSLGPILSKDRKGIRLSVIW